VKNGYTTIAQNGKGHGISPAMHQYPRQNRISMAPSLCSVFGGSAGYGILRTAPT